MIDRDSIKKNPNAGNTVTHKSTGVSIEFTCCRYSKEKLLYHFRYRADRVIDENMPDQMTTDDDIKQIIETVLVNPYCLSMVITEKYEDPVLDIDYNIQAIGHMPEPKYHYEYEKTKVKCNKCGESVFETEFLSDSYWDGEEEFYSDDICPKCKAWDAFDIEYETINDATKGLK